MVQRRALVAEVLLARVRCEFPNCNSGSEQVHEPLTRARGGSILDLSNTVVLCNDHHRWVHDNPSAATALGLLVSGYGA
jgi:hypothetical protein